MGLSEVLGMTVPHHQAESWNVVESRAGCGEGGGGVAVSASGGVDDPGWSEPQPQEHQRYPGCVYPAPGYPQYC